MPYLKQGTNFLYDNTTNDIVGVRDEDGGDKYFPIMRNEPTYAGATAAVSIVAPATTFNTLSYEDSSGSVRLTSTGVHGLTNAVAQNKLVRVTWTGGTGVNGLYTVTDVSAATTKITINYPHAAGLGTPAVAVVATDITLASATIPANAIKPGMELEIDALFAMTGSANNKTLKVNIGDAGWYSQAVAGSNVSVSLDKQAWANTATTLVSNALAAPGHGASTGANVTMTPTGGFGIAQTFAITGQIATANEFITLEAWNLKITST
jgi:hypothetical protein